MTFARQIAEQIHAKFPTLQLDISTEDPNVDWVIDIPEQPGLKFRCQLNCQGDELHMSVGCFWLEWFPDNDEKIRNAFIDAILGVISGKYRILEYVRWGHEVGAELQAPEGNSWKTIGNSSKGILPRNWLSRTRALQNA